MANEGSALRSITELFVTAALAYPDRAFIHLSSGRRITYAETASRVVGIVDHLRNDLGLRRNGAIVAYTQETVPLLLLLLAAAVGGFVLVPVSDFFSSAQLEDIQQRVGATQLFTGSRIPAPLAKGASVQRCVVDDEIDTRDDCLPNTPSMPVEHVHGVMRDALANAVAGDVVLVLPTSGSTGRPKLVMRSHKACVRIAHFAANDLAPDWRERETSVLMALTLTHGLAYLWIAFALQTAARLVVPTEADTAASLKEVRTLDPELLPMVPRMLRSFRMQAGAVGTSGRLFGPSARVVWLAGAPADVTVLKELIASGIEVGEGYGATESSPISHGIGAAWREGYQGKLLPDVEVRLADDGELLVRTPGMMEGYLGDEELTRAVLTDDGFYRTGDLVELDAAGYVRVFGRKRDVFNTNDGSNVYPAAIEGMLEERIPEVIQAFMIGDRRDFLSVFFVMRSAESSEADGYLAPEHAPALYSEIRRRLEEINLSLGRMERLRAFALFASPFPDVVYARVSQGKVRRDRVKFEATFKRRIDTLYSAAERTSPSFVPQIEITP